MELKEYVVVTGGVHLITSNGRMQVDFITPEIARIRYTLKKEFITKESKSTIIHNALSSSSIKVVENEHSLDLISEQLKIKVDRATCAFIYMDLNGNLLLKEPEKGGKSLNEVDLIKTTFDETVEYMTDQSADGLKVKAGGVEKVIEETTYHSKLEFDWQEGEALYGLGSHEEGMMNLRGNSQYLYQQNMKVSIPTLVSTNGYGILVDNSSFMTFRDDAYGSYLWCDAADEMDYYFIYGPEFDSIIKGIRRLTGDAPILPKWAYGYIQSKEHYSSQKELIDTVQTFRDLNLPLDCIVLDWKSWKEGLWGEKILDPERFPDPVKMMEDIHENNAKLMVSIWPNMAAGGENHLEMKKKGFLLGNQSTYDAFNKEARELYWKQVNDGFFVHGVDAWWCDCSEPFEGDWKGEVKPEPEERLLINTEESKKYLDPRTMNAYSLLHSEGIYLGQRAASSEKRVVNLTRSAYAGQHRYGTITWSGDISATWDTYKKQISDGLNFSVTGSPYWTFDIGGFFVKNDPKLWFWNGDYECGTDDLGYRELYVRWFQTGVFMPMFRAHGTDTPRELWQFGKPGEPHYDALEKYLKLRYHLMPYIYSLAGQVYHTSYTILRALAFEFREDKKTHDIKDQFMFGPAFMVAPITKPMYHLSNSREIKQSDESRNVYLPEGTWFNYWDNEKLTGGRAIEAKADLMTIPLFVRAGAIVPTGPAIQYAEDKANAAIHLKVYPGSDGSFTFYEDEGDNYNYETGAFSQIKLKWKDKDQTLYFEKREGRYRGMPKEKEFHVEIVSDYKTQSILYKGENEKLIF